MKRVLFCSTKFFVAFAALSSLFPHQASLARMYSADDNTIIDNPERGLRDQQGARLEHIKLKLVPVFSSNGTLLDLKFGTNVPKDPNNLNAGYKVVTSSLDDHLAVKFQDAKANGKKLIPRPHFIWLEEDGEYPSSVERLNQVVDAYILKIKKHISYIAYFEAGFLGNFGEWHDSATTKKMPSYVNDSVKHNLVTKLANAFPSRTVAIRYPLIKLKAIKDGQGGFGSFERRIGHHNDCFHGTKVPSGGTARYDDEGTFQQDVSLGLTTPSYGSTVWTTFDDGTAQQVPAPFLLRDYQKYDAKDGFKDGAEVNSWLAKAKLTTDPSKSAPQFSDRLGVPLGGEMCSQLEAKDMVDPKKFVHQHSPLFYSDMFVRSLQYSGWDDIAVEQVFQDDFFFKQEAIPKMQRKLGYRFQLQEANVFMEGPTITGSIRIKNTGWGKLYNHKRLLIVLYNTSNPTPSKRFGGVFDVTNASDLRLIKSGKERQFDFKWVSSQTPVAPGWYDVYLKIVDSDPSDKSKIDTELSNKQAYNIRLAYQSDQTEQWFTTGKDNNLNDIGGLNKLGIVVEVK